MPTLTEFAEEFENEAKHALESRSLYSDDPDLRLQFAVEAQTWRLASRRLQRAAEHEAAAAAPWTGAPGC